MENRWSDSDAAQCVSGYAEQWGEALALRTYTSRLIGADPNLVLHGGGNTSLKATWRDIFGEPHEALYIKASGQDLARMAPEGHVPVDLAFVRRLAELPGVPDPTIAELLRSHSFDQRVGAPSIETPVHAVLPAQYVDHTHADAVLALTNRPDGEARVRDALGDSVVVLPYLIAGFELSKAVANAIAAAPDCDGMVLMCHGVLTWGETARQSYERMVALVSRAEDALRRRAGTVSLQSSKSSIHDAQRRLGTVAPMLRGMLSTTLEPARPMVLRALVDQETLDLLDAPAARALLESPPLTADHLIRTKVVPAWVEDPRYDDEDQLREQIRATLAGYAEDYRTYLGRHAERLPAGVETFDPLPRIVLVPGLGALCAGHDARSACIARDITRQTLATKALMAADGAAYQGISEPHLFDMEYRSLQHAKLARGSEPPLAGRVALVTGAAGAIGAAICEELLEAGAHVAATDLASDALESLVASFKDAHSERIAGITVDVTREDSVRSGFDAASCAWGGVDLIVVNAGLAHVAGLDEMDFARFQALERVNIDGTLLVLAEAARHLKRQAMGGDIVLISTKNVFSPGARFGAYSATKAAAHQLARIASLELAPHDVRVNMVAPDAVFSYGERQSGLWQTVGPDRMKARGLDAAQLRDYYRSRNLLRAEVTGRHVANAVLFFATRQTPTTGATLPVDGGLPDATPR